MVGGDVRHRQFGREIGSQRNAGIDIGEDQRGDFIAIVASDDDVAHEWREMG